MLVRKINFKACQDALYTALAIVVCLLLGKALSYGLGGLPASLYGMISFALALYFKVFDAEKIRATIQLIIKNMGICFVPAGVGAMNYLGLLQNQGLVIFVMILTTTLLLIAVVGWLGQYILAKNNHPHSANVPSDDQTSAEQGND